MKPPPQTNLQPDFSEEAFLLKNGFGCVAGLDEVGRGCLAGPVVAAAVILNPQCLPIGINDSKKLSHAKRKEWDKIIKKEAIDFSIGFASNEEIDEINILEASKLAMIRALHKLKVKADYLLLDGNFGLPVGIPFKPVIKGDSKVLSIAAASVVAKVFRDEWMEALDCEFPGYELARNKGYGSVPHRLALQSKGLSPLHRKTFQWRVL